MEWNIVCLLPLHYLKLRMLLQSVGIDSVSAVVRSVAGLGVAHAPLLGAHHAQKRVGVHGAGAHLAAVRQQHAARTHGVIGPVLLQTENRVLETQALCRNTPTRTRHDSFVIVIIIIIIVIIIVIIIIIIIGIVVIE